MIQIEVEFQIPSKLRVAGIIRNRTGYCFGLEFINCSSVLTGALASLPL